MSLHLLTGDGPLTDRPVATSQATRFGIVAGIGVCNVLGMGEEILTSQN